MAGGQSMLDFGRSHRDTDNLLLLLWSCQPSPQPSMVAGTLLGRVCLACRGRCREEPKEGAHADAPAEVGTWVDNGCQ